MSARCTECQEHLSNDPYPDEKQLAGECDGYCGRYMCEDCAIRHGGICTACKAGLAEPDDRPIFPIPGPPPDPPPSLSFALGGSFAFGMYIPFVILPKRFEKF